MVNRIVSAGSLAAALALGLVTGSSSIAAPETAAPATSEIAFANRLMAAVGDARSGDLVLSPANIYDALAMLLPGAHGATESQLRAAMHASAEPESLLASSVQLQNHLNGGGVDLAAARAAWLEKTFPALPSYAAILTRAGAPLQLIDFINAPDAARKSVNAWATEHTHGRIRDLLPPRSVDSNARLILATAMALDARWATPFKESDTSLAPFHGKSGTTTALTMRATATFGYSIASGYQAAELPFENSRLAAVIVLPRAGVDPLAMLPDLGTISAAMRPQRVALALPRAQLSTSLNLQSGLTSLGLGQLFTPSADLSGIGGRPGDLDLGVAVHEAQLAIDENGVQAAAATALGIAESLRLAPHSAIQMNVDRPFLFVVRDQDIGIPLFVARITDIG